MKKLGIITSVLIGVAMLGNSSGSVIAASSVDTTPVQEVVAQAEQPYQGIVGAVTEDSDIANGIVILETKNLGEVEVLLEGGTIYKIPGQDEATKDDIEVGDRLAILATVVSITPAISFWGSWDRKAGLLTLVCWITFFLIVSQQLHHRTQLFRAIYALLLSSGIVSVLGILQYYFPDVLYRLFHYTHSGRVLSTIGNPLFLSGFLAMVIPLNLAFIVNSWRRWL